MKYVSRIAGAVAFGLLSVSVAYAQATINDCEKIQAADAYNQCLAKFGPTSKLKSLEPERPSDVKDSSAEAAASAGHGGGHGRVAVHRGGGRHRGRHASRHGGGRKHMVIRVGRRRHR